MNKKITPEKVNDLYRLEQEERVVAPSERTLDFLKSFARVYYAEKSLSSKINGFCLN